MTTIRSLGVNVAVLIALAVIPPALATELEAIDENGYEVPEKIDFCQLGDERISHISTIKKIIEKFESTPGPGSCRNHWLYPLEQLKSIFAETEKDACSMATVEKIEAFHWDYIVSDLSETWKSKVEQKSPGLPKTPEAVKMFFMHFVDKILDKCESVLGERIKHATDGFKFEAKTLTSAGSWGNQIDFNAKSLTHHSKIKNFDDFFLPFMVIATKNKKESGDLQNTIEMREVCYGKMEMTNPSVPLAARQMCTRSLRPIYYNSVLPVMRLIDLGYGYKDTAFTDEKNKNLLANWYRITQLCQVIIPVQYVYDKSGSEQGEYTKQMIHAEPNMIPSDVKFKPVPLDDILPAANDDRVVNRIKSNFKSRSSYFSRAYGLMMSNRISKIKNIFGCGSACE